MQYFCSDIDMIRIFTRRKRLLTIILLTMFIALGARAQDDEDIAHSLNLTEVVVLADGMTFEEYLLKQVLEHAKPLKDRTKSLKYTVTCQVEKDMERLPLQPVWLAMVPSCRLSGSISTSASPWRRMWCSRMGR